MSHLKLYAEKMNKHPILVVIAILSTVSIAFGDTEGGEAKRDQMTLGSLKLLQARSLPLQKNTPTGNFERHADFFRRVGGIAFSQQAINETGLRVERASYDPTKGQLTLVMGTDTIAETPYHLAIPAWQFCPIVRYVNSKFDSCFTLFGEMPNVPDRPEHSWFVNYHPAFEDTLLGLRLLQADIMVFVPDASDLPKLNDRYVNGTGEPVHVAEDNLERHLRIQRWIQGQGHKPYDSYLLGDIKRPVSLAMKNGSLSITGTPIWYCWKHGGQYSTAEEFAKASIRSELLGDMLNLPDEELKDKYTDTYISKRLKTLKDEFGKRQKSSKEIEFAEEFSNELTDLIERNEGSNPVVYASLHATMRFSALLRMIKKENPAVFKGLLLSVEKVAVLPAVDTPEIIDYTASIKQEE